MVAIRNIKNTKKITNNELLYSCLKYDIGMDTESMKSLSKRIKISQTLQALYLYNDINTKLMKYLSEGIKINKTLTRLALWCDVNIESMKYLSNAIKDSETLTHLYLCYDINKESMKYLTEAIKDNQILTHFYSKYEIDAELMKCINKSLEENERITRFKNACKNNQTNIALNMLIEYNEKCYSTKASNNIINEDAIYWILKNKMKKVAKELIIKCNVMKRLYHRGPDIINLIKNYS